MKIKYVFGVLFLSLIFTLFIHNSVNAGYVPGTIAKSNSSGTETCPFEASQDYEWTSAGCTIDTGSCQLYKSKSSETVCGCETYAQTCTVTPDPGEPIIPGPGGPVRPDVEGPEDSEFYYDDVSFLKQGLSFLGIKQTSALPIVTCVDDLTTCVLAKTCRDTSFGCETYNTKVTRSSNKFYDRISVGSKNIINNGSLTNAQKKAQLGAIGCSVQGYDFTTTECSGGTTGAYGAPGGKIAIGVGSTCGVTCDGTQHTPPSGGTTMTCDNNSTFYFSITGESGTCTCESSNNLVSSFNQLGVLSRYGTTTNGGTCNVEGLYATVDNSGPIISVTDYGTISNDDTQWCNLNKYKGIAPFSGVYGSNTNINTPGCEHYNKTDGLDLVDNFSINVKDVSGLSKVQVELGTCSAYYDFSGLALTDLLSSVTTSNGIDPAYSELTINAYTPSTYGISGIVSLKTLFGKTRLDECLSEGENYLQITADDSARLASDAISLQANQSSFIDKSYAIRIDNSGPTFRPVSTYDYDNNYKEQVESEFDASFNQIDWKKTWYNSTIDGSFIMNDGVNQNEVLCTQYIQNGTGTCPAVPGKVWKSPVLADGTYAKYECDGIVITDDSVCNFSCESGYVLSADSSTCEPMPVIYDWYNAGYAGGCILGSEYKLVSCADVTDSSNTTDISACNMVNLKSTLATGESIYNEGSLTGSEASLLVQKNCSNPFIIGTSKLGSTDTLGN